MSVSTWQRLHCALKHIIFNGHCATTFFLLLQIKLCLTGSLPTDGYHLIRTSYNPTSKNLNYHFKMMKIVNIILYIKHVLALWCWQTLSAVITQHIYCIWARSRILCQTKKSTNKSNLPMFRFSKCHVITVNMCSVECWRIRINNPSCPLNTSISQSNFCNICTSFCDISCKPS